MILKYHKQRKQDVEVIIIPDMESINFGRGVGYEVNKYTPTEEIANISATSIRESIKLGNEYWRKLVPVELQEDIISNIR